MWQQELAQAVFERALRDARTDADLLIVRAHCEHRRFPRMWLKLRLRQYLDAVTFLHAPTSLWSDLTHVRHQSLLAQWGPAHGDPCSTTHISTGG